MLLFYSMTDIVVALYKVTNRSHRHPVLSQHPGWRMLPAVRCPTLHLYRPDYLDYQPHRPLLCPGLDPPLRKMVKEHSFDKGYTFESG